MANYGDSSTYSTASGKGRAAVRSFTGNIERKIFRNRFRKSVRARRSVK